MTVSVAFDKTSYTPDEPINFQILIEGEPVSVSRDVTFTGTVTLPEQNPRTVSGTTTVVNNKVVYGAFAADGYDVVQDPSDPSRYTATPVAA